jgi:TRAP-type C4-dicarboxylate transport system substrate-binding protein
MDGGSRSLYTKKPVRKPEDLKGQKIRMMGNPLFVDTMNAMGGNGIAMGYGEVFTAMQTGVIDGAENNPPSLFTANHFKAGAKYYTQTNHLIIPEILVMSKVTWDKLSAADQALVKKGRARRSWNSAQLWDKAWPTTPPSSRPKAWSSSRSTTSPSTTPPHRCAPSTAPSSPT